MDKTCPHKALSKNGDYWICQKCQKQLDRRTVIDFFLAKTYRQSENSAPTRHKNPRVVLRVR